MSTTIHPWPSTVNENSGWLGSHSLAIRRSKRINPLSVLPAVLVCVIGWSAYWFSSPLLLWTALVPALAAGLASPVRLVQLLVITAPVFPVIRLQQDMVDARQFSTKGLFLSVDDPLIVALVLAWGVAWLRRRQPRAEMFPSALVWLGLVYPLAILANVFRLAPNQTMVSLLYYLKWAQYAALILIIPRIVPAAQVPPLLSSLRKLLLIAIGASAVFATYETIESIRTSSFTGTARFPRASAFFGTLNPAKFGASEDPVNFGVFAMVASGIALSLWSNSRQKGRTFCLISLLSSFLCMLLSASRAPLIAGAVSTARIQRFRVSHILVLIVAALVTGIIIMFVAPQVWSTVAQRFDAMTDWQANLEHSAMTRLTVVLHSPVFDMDQYWLTGHGFFSYRFVAEEHLSRITGGITHSLYNFPMTVWYDAGPVGLTLWIVLFLQLNKRFLLIASSPAWAELRALAWGLRGALWGLAAASMFSEIPYGWRVMGFFYTCCGICFAGELAWRRTFWKQQRG